MLPFVDADPRFQELVTDLAGRYCKPVETVYDSWREYSKLCDTYDQSAIFPEFEKWYFDRLSVLDLLAIGRRDRPNVRYAVSKDGAALGAWDDALGRFVAVVMRGINATWVRCDYEVFIDGQPSYQPGDWTE